MTASFDAVSLVHGNQPDVVSTIAVVARRLRTKLELLNLIDIRKGTKPQRDEITRRRDADGFRIGNDMYVRSKGWKEISSVDGRALAAHKILKTETRGDVLTVSKKIAGIKQKLRYYIIDSKALDQALRPPERTKVSPTV
jgi:hypothetical protein